MNDIINMKFLWHSLIKKKERKKKIWFDEESFDTKRPREESSWEEGAF